MEKITVETTVQASLQKIWDFWTGIEHIAGWAFASDDWGGLKESPMIYKKEERSPAGCLQKTEVLSSILVVPTQK